MSISKKDEGEVRIRSNVCTKPDAWDLVPGDLYAKISQYLPRLNARQKDEKMYYVSCCLCNRTIFEINEEGCDEIVCRDQGIMSKVEAKLRKSRLG